MMHGQKNIKLSSIFVPVLLNKFPTLHSL